MNEFLTALKDDLLDRRLLPFVALVGVALLAALAYAVLGGGSSTPTPPSPPAVATSPGGIAVNQTGADPKQALAETTSGAVDQRQGLARDPFTPLPGAAHAAPASTFTSAKSASGTPASTAGGTSQSKGAGAGTGSSGGGGGGPTPSPKPTPKQTTVYHVTVQFGTVPLPLSAVLPTLPDLKLLTPLPSASQPLIVYRGVAAGGKSVLFTVVGEAILHGSAKCLPSAAQCQQLEVAPGQAEVFEYLMPGGTPVTDELRVVSIEASTASSASAAALLHNASRAGREALASAGMLTAPGLRATSQIGVLSFDNAATVTGR